MWCSHDFCESILITLDFLSCSWPSIILSVASASASSKGCHIYKSTLGGNMINYIVKLHTKNVDFTFPSFLLFLFWIAKAILPFPLIFLFFWIRLFFSLDVYRYNQKNAAGACALANSMVMITWFMLWNDWIKKII